MSIIPILQGKKATQLPILPVLSGNEVLYVVAENGVSSQTKASAVIDLLASVGSGALLASNNLSDLTNKPAARINLGLGSLATQNSNQVTITGGTINDTPIGIQNPSVGKFTNIEVTETFIVPPNSIDINNIAGLIPNAKLEHSSIDVNYYNGLNGDGLVNLGGELNITIDYIDGGTF